MNFLVVCYDIADRRRRYRVARLLEGFGDRVQKSVFECRLDRERESSLRRELNALIKPAEDKLRFYCLCGKDRALVLAFDRKGIVRPVAQWLL